MGGGSVVYWQCKADKALILFLDFIISIGVTEPKENIETLDSIMCFNEVQTKKGPSFHTLYSSQYVKESDFRNTISWRKQTST